MYVDDNVLSEARNLRNMSMAQTPLLGDENTPLHVGPAGGTGFEGATPRHQVAFTPNPLATPMHGGTSDVSATPRTDGQSVISATPLRTPMRDNLSINPSDGYSMVGDTPRERRLRNDSAKRALKAGFMSLPKPENNFELLVPEEEEEEEEGEQVNGFVLSEEDAAERDARRKKKQEEEQRKMLARRSQAVQLGLPRPANVDVERLLQDLSVDEEETPAPGEAQRLIDVELAQILQHDSIAHPVPGTSRPGGTRSAYIMPSDEDIADAKAQIHLELAASLGFPDANDGQIREGLAALSKLEEFDETSSWAHIRQQLTFDATSKIWMDATKLSATQRVAGYIAQLEGSRDLMSKEANKASKSEKKLGVTLGGYQARSKALSKRITDAFEDLQRTKVDLESFSQLRVNESAAGPRRVSALKEEVEKLERREKTLQERYAELDLERKESEARVAALEERVMVEAEALNEAALAEMEGLE
jgi:pre-mRNA-splicing factor CDC5/CEF1